jgi:outer membrane biosynthesis protein TonB
MTLRAPLFLAFAASLSFHALAIFSLGKYAPWSSNQGFAEDAILISYVEPLASLPNASPAPAPKEVLRKVAPAAKKAVPSRPGPEVAARRKGIKPYYPPEPPAPKSGADFLTDPVKGRILADYFGLVKRRIDATARKRYSEAELGMGTVSLAFTLNADGTLAAVSVAEKQTKAPVDVRNFAVRCVRETAPFIAFPPELDVPYIAFNVTLLFDEL